MPAAMRGESRAEAKPRAKAPASTKSAPRARKPGATYAPGKLGARAQCNQTEVGAHVGVARAVDVQTGVVVLVFQEDVAVPAK